jgi:hypothetical protein
MCAEGHNGSLCGTCKVGYGSLGLTLKCGKCLPARALWALLRCGYIVVVLLVSYTVHAMWRDNNVDDNHRSEVGTSDLVKLLIMFAQYLLVIGSLSPGFPDALDMLSKTIDILLDVSSFDTIYMDCFLAPSAGSSPASAVTKLLAGLVRVWCHQ